MEVSPDVLGRAIAEHPMHLAVFDVQLREQTGQWYLDEPIPIREVVERLAEDDAFLEESGTLRLPLHESGSAALSDEFLRVDRDTGTVQFYDPGIRRVRRLALADLERTYAAWRLRYWTTAYRIEEEPPFMESLAPTPRDEPALPPDGPTPSPEGLEADAFFEAVRSTLVAIRERQRDTMRETFEQLPPREFLDAYGGIRGLYPAGREVDEYGQQIIQLGIPEAHELAACSAAELRERTRLGPGDEVVIDGRQSDSLPVEAELFSISDDGLELGVYWDSAKGSQAEEAFDEQLDVRLTVGKLIDGRRYQTVANAIDTVDRTDHARERYAGTTAPTFGELPELDPDEALNRDQELAVGRGLASEDVLCVHGPPWTGTRRVIWTLVRHAVSNGDRVILCSPSPETLNHLLGDTANESWSMIDRAEKVGIDFSVARSPVDDLDIGADACAITIDAAGVIDDHSADLAILDHAGRVDVPTGAVPFAKAGRVILVGDPWQGPPPTETRSALPRSIYDHLASVDRDATVALRTQYRMHQAIAQFPNRRFYEGTLVTAGQNRTWTIDTLAPLEAIHVPTDVTSTPTGSLYHDGEIQVVLDEVRSLIERGVDPRAIGVLTPFSAQVGKVRVALNEIDDNLGEQVHIGGLDQFRCRSCEAVIVSFVGTAEPSASLRGEGADFTSIEGLNLALTRAERRLVLLGDWGAMRGRGGTYTALCDFLEDRDLVEGDGV